MISLGLFIARMLGKTIGLDTAKKWGMYAAIPVLIIILGLGLWVGKYFYDRGVVETSRLEQDAALAKDARKADQQADAQLVERTAVAEAENEKLENAMQTAKQADPEKGKRVVGKVQQSYFDNLPKGK